MSVCVGLERPRREAVLVRGRSGAVRVVVRCWRYGGKGGGSAAGFGSR